MRSVLFFLGLVLSSSSEAKPFLSEDGIAAYQSGSPYVSYVRRSSCVRRESSPCHDVRGIDLNRSSLQMVREGEWEAAEQVEACSDTADCQDKRTAKVCPGPEYFAFYGDLDEDFSSEVWCTRRGLVQRLRPDSSMESADDARKASLASRRAALSQIRTRLGQCARMNLSSVTPAQVAQCVKAVAKELVKTQLQLNEL